MERGALLLPAPVDAHPHGGVSMAKGLGEPADPVAGRPRFRQAAAPILLAPGA